jgi:hypothetical protein
MKVLLGAILLLLVGCSGVVQAQGEDTDAQIAALTERVAELEDQVSQLRDWVCDDSYPEVCIPSPPPDLNCRDIQYRRFEVVPPDPHGFDRMETGLGVKARWAGLGVVPSEILLLGNSRMPLLGDYKGWREGYGESGRGIRTKPPLKAPPGEEGLKHPLEKGTSSPYL